MCFPLLVSLPLSPSIHSPLLYAVREEINEETRKRKKQRLGEGKEHVLPTFLVVSLPASLLISLPPSSPPPHCVCGLRQVLEAGHVTRA